MNKKDYFINKNTSLRDALALIDKLGTGIAILVNYEGKFDRTVTDGDLRRLILNGSKLEDDVSILPQINSTVSIGSTTRVVALAIMDEKNLDHLPLVDENGFLIDVFNRRTISKRIYLSAPHMGEYEKEYINDAFRTNWIAPIGPNVTGFENEIAAMLGIKSAVALSSGSAALHLALIVLGVTEGDTVFCSSFTFVASANPILYQKAEPIFIDSESESWNMSPKALERALFEAKAADKLPKAILVVNLYGQSADMDPIIELADAFNVPIIEDAAESLGAKYKGKASGTFGRLGIYSFNGNKIITTSGGGMLVSDDSDLIDKARFLSTQARESAVHYEHKEVGFNYRMSNILAGVGRGQLRVLKQRVDARRNIFNAYKQAFSEFKHISWMPEPDWSYSNRWLSVFTLNTDVMNVDIRSVLTTLDQEMIEARPVWKPLHLQPLFKGTKYYPHDNFSVSDRLYETGVCLPSGSAMTTEDVQRVSDTIKALIK